MRHKDIDWNPKSDCARVDLPLLAFETMSYECEICQGRGHVRGIDCRVCGGLGVRRSSCVIRCGRVRVRIINADAAIKFHVRQEVALAVLGKEFEAGVIPGSSVITLPDSDFDGWFFPAGSYEIVTP